MKTKGKSKPGPRPLSRRLLDDAILDLQKRMEVQERHAHALRSLVIVNGKTPACVHDLCIGLGLALEKHAEGMRNLSGFIDIIAERAVQS